MKKQILIIMLLLLAGNCFSQYVFYKRYGLADYSNDGGFSVIQTSDNGFVSVGNTYDTHAKFFIVRTLANGDTLWQKQYNFAPAGGDDGNSVLQLTDGTFSICGTTYDSIEHASNIYILKLDQNGEIIYFKPINIGFNDCGMMHKQTADKGFIIGGFFNVTKGKVFLVKTDSLGDVQWSRQYAADTLENVFYSFDVTPSGGYILGGYYRNSVTYKRHLFLIKTDSVGQELWNKSYGDSICNEYKGYVTSTLDKGYIQIGFRKETNNSYNRLVIKTDSIGNIIWEKTFGFPDYYDALEVVKQLPDSSYITAGSFSDTRFSPSMPRVFLMKLNTHGDTVWTKKYTYWGAGYQYGAVTHDYVMDLKLTNDFGFVMCGYLLNNLVSSKNDLFIIKTDSLGNTCQIDTTTYAGCSYQECNYTHAVFSVSSDTIDLQYTDTIHFYNHSTFTQHWFWNFADNHTDTIQNPLHVFDTTGVYNVMLVASLNACSDTTYKAIVVKNSVGISSILNNQSSAFNIFPNPVTQILSVSSNETNLYSINLYNFNNQLLLQSKGQNKQMSLNLNNYPQGIYFLQIITEKNIIMKKIIKE